MLRQTNNQMVRPIFLWPSRAKKPIIGRFWLIVVIAGVLWPGSIAASDGQTSNPSEPSGLTVEEAVEQTLSRQSIQGGFEQRLKQRKASVTEARRFPNPVFSFDHEHAFGGARGAENFFMLEQSLPVLGRSRRSEAAEIRVGAERQRIRGDRMWLATETRLRWLDWAASCRRAEVRGEFVERLEEGMQVVRQRVDAGEAPKLDGSRFRRELTASRVDRTEAQAGCEGAWSKLAALMGRSGEVAIASEKMPAAEGMLLGGRTSPDELSSALRQVSGAPDLEAKRREAEALEERADYERLARWSNPSIRGGFRSLHSPGQFDPGFVAGISVPLPLFYRRTGEIRRLEARAGAERSQLRQQTQRRRGLVASAWRRAERLTESARMLERKGLRAARRAAQRARAGYEGGEVSLTTYLDAVRELEGIRLRLVELKERARREWIRVRRLTGNSDMHSGEERQR